MKGTTVLTLNVKNVQQIDLRFKFSASPLKLPVVFQSIYEYSAPGVIQISHELSFYQISTAAAYCQNLTPSHITNFQQLLSICIFTAFCYLTLKIHFFIGMRFKPPHLMGPQPGFYFQDNSFYLQPILKREAPDLL